MHVKRHDLGLCAIKGMAALLLAACTLSDGEPMGTLSGTVALGYAPLPERALPEGWQKLASGYAVRVVEAEATLAPLRIEAESGAAGATRFDPASPPPGFGVCHNGHCHADDGRLVPYEEIEAQLAGGGEVAATTVLSLPLGKVSLLAGARAPLSAGPPLPLSRGTLTRALLPVSSLRFAGEVRDDVVPPRFAGVVAWQWSAGPLPDAALATLDAPLGLPVDRAHEPHVELAITWAPNARLFDAVDWAAGVAAAPAGSIVVAAGSPLHQTLLSALQELGLSVLSQRRD